MTPLLFVGPGADQVEQVLETVGKQVASAVPPSTQAQQLWQASAPDRAAVQAALAAQPHLLYFGHGTCDALGDPALVDGSNVALLRGRIVLAMACSSADTLGSDAVNNKGVAAYLGFTLEIFVPLGSVTWSLTPWYVAGTQLVTGASVGQVASDTQRAFRNEGDRIHANAPDGDTQADNDRLLMYGMALAFVCLTNDTSLTI